VQRADLPASLGEIFSVQQAREAGVSASRLRARDLTKPYRGVRTDPARTDPPAEEDDKLSAGRRAELDLMRRARQYGMGMSDEAFFTHITAAVMWGVPLPTGTVTEILDVGMLTPGRAPRGAGIRGHQIAAHLGSARVHPLHALRVASPATTWAMLGAVLQHPYDLVAAADHLVRIPRMPGGFEPAPGARTEACATVTQLAAAVTSGRRVGIGALREALPRVRTGASSRRETWLRLILVDAGLPEPMLDHDVRDVDGRFIACLDLAYPDLRIGVEYDGDHHRTEAGQWAHDVDRLDRLAEEGWRIIRATKTHIFSMQGVVTQRVRAAIDSRT
jgi:hypothetical protein